MILKIFFFFFLHVICEVWLIFFFQMDIWD